MATQLLLIKKHHVSYTGHGPPHKRVFSCEVRMQVPEAWKDLGFLGGADTRADDTWVDAALAFAERNAEARGVPCPARLAEGSGKERGQSVLELVAGGLDFSKSDGAALGDPRLVRRRATRHGEHDRPENPDEHRKNGQGSVKRTVKARRGRGPSAFGAGQRLAPERDVRAESAGWAATVTAYVDGGKSLTATGVGSSKGDAEDCAYGSIVDALRETIGPARHAALMRVVEDSPGALGGVAPRAASAGRRHGRAHQRHGHARGPRQAHGGLARRRAGRHGARAGARARGGATKRPSRTRRTTRWTAGTGVGSRSGTPPFRIRRRRTMTYRTRRRTTIR